MQIDSRQKEIITFLIIIIIVGVISFLSGKRSGLHQGRAENMDKITELDKVVNFFVPPVPNEIFQTSGEIKSIDKDIITLEIVSLQERRLPGIEPKKEIKKVITSTDTEIIKIDFSAFTIPSKSKTLPLGPKEIQLEFSDLKVGDYISVTSLENIKNKESFNASRIVTQNTKSLPIYPKIKS